MRIIQTADLHLDAPFGYLPSILRKQRRESIRNAFKKIVGLTLDRDVDVLIIAGDLFDTHNPPRDTVNFISSELKKLGEVKKKVLITPGNHDFYAEDSIYHSFQFMENVHIFREGEFTEYYDSKHGVVFYGVAGQSFKSDQNVLKDFRVKNDELVNIGILHGSLDYGYFHGEQCYPFKSADFSTTGLDYLALGHYHNFKVEKENKPMVYSGSPSALNFTETDQRIALLVELEEDKFEFEKIPIDDYVYKIFELDCTDIQTSENIKEEISRNADDKAFLRVALKGTPHLELNVDIENLEEGLNDKFAFLQIMEKFSFPQITGYEDARTIKSLFIQTMKKKIEDASQEEKQLYDV